MVEQFFCRNSQYCCIRAIMFVRHQWRHCWESLTHIFVSLASTASSLGMVPVSRLLFKSLHAEADPQNDMSSEWRWHDCTTHSASHTSLYSAEEYGLKALVATIHFHFSCMACLFKPCPTMIFKLTIHTIYLTVGTKLCSLARQYAVGDHICACIGCMWQQKLGQIQWRQSLILKNFFIDAKMVIAKHFDQYLKSPAISEELNIYKPKYLE